MKKIGLILLALLSANCFAEVEEWTSKVYVKEVSFNDTQPVWVLKAVFDQAPKSASCTLNTELNYSSAATTPQQQMMMSVLLSAQAQNKPVKVWIRFCDQKSLLSGVKIVNE